ncbi:glycosyltransferase family 2 protein [Lacticaseibacillus daqingensis]|uniref:glycosyltransferase family 2 protein n=1 Tax=Lacticaseibacillus daqingensis TaxID=2486014 RepID=UPI000F76B042|nr:glycosyltransferase family 2 protein [Lacticaseibacillus daqingensis]
MTKVVVLMATYNGANFIREQIQSIQAQDFTEWKLHIHDDGSTDATVSLIQTMAAVDSRICLEDSLPKHLGAKQGFHELLKMVTADYYFFSDQDDVWLPKKISQSLKQIRTLTGPALVYTDLTVVDQTLQTLQPSMHRANQYPNQLDFNHLLVQNSVTGCTVVLNEELKQIVCAQSIIPAAMHDWWYALVAAARGQLVYLNEATILYRQHGNNVVGATTPLWKRALRLDAKRQATSRLREVQRQAGAIRAQGVAIKSTDQADVQIVSTLLTAGRWRTVWALGTRRILKTGVLKNLLFFVLILTRPRASSSNED